MLTSTRDREYVIELKPTFDGLFAQLADVSTISFYQEVMNNLPPFCCGSSPLRFAISGRSPPFYMCIIVCFTFFRGIIFSHVLTPAGL